MSINTYLTFSYNQKAAVRYCEFWAFKRNPKYYDFSDLGGDCTNFISQCLYAGCLTMNYIPDYGWYFISPSNRSPAWTSVRYLYNFLTTNKGIGPFGVECKLEELVPGDIVQLGNSNNIFYHSLLVTKTSKTPSLENVLIGTHTIDSLNRPLSSYTAQYFRYIHIQGFRKIH